MTITATYCAARIQHEAVNTANGHAYICPAVCGYMMPSPLGTPAPSSRIVRTCVNYLLFFSKLRTAVYTHTLCSNLGVYTN